MYGDSPAKNTVYTPVYTPYIPINVWFGPTLAICTYARTRAGPSPRSSRSQRGEGMRDKYTLTRTKHWHIPTSHTSALSLTRFLLQESERIRAAAEAKGHQKRAHTNVSLLRAFSCRNQSFHSRAFTYRNQSASAQQQRQRATKNRHIPTSHTSALSFTRFHVQESERIRAAAEAKGEEVRVALERTQARLRQQLTALQETASQAVANGDVGALAGVYVCVCVCACVCVCV